VSRDDGEGDQADSARTLSLGCRQLDMRESSMATALAPRGTRSRA
jgi:hypothetical protein